MSGDRPPTGHHGRAEALSLRLRNKGLSVVEASPALLAGARLAVRAVRLPLEPGRMRRSRRRLDAACELIPGVLRQVGVESGPAAGGEPKVVSATWSGAGAAIVKVQVGPGGAAVIVKLLPGEGAPGLYRGAEVLRELRNDPRLGDLVRLLPTPIGHGQIDGQAYTVDWALPGSGAGVMLTRPGSWATIRPAAASVISELHRRTGRAVTVDADLLSAWIDGPAQVVARVSRHPERVAALADELGGTWAGRPVVVSWIHGDFWPGNLLVAPTSAAPNASAVAVTGIVDWKWAASDGLPQHDLLQLLVYTRMMSAGVELGTVLRALLDRAVWDPAEQRILDAARPSEVEPVGDQSMLLLYWLRHVSLTLTRSPQFSRDWVWMARNVEGVLDACARRG